MSRAASRSRRWRRKKSRLQVESYSTGTLTKIIRQEGETIPVGEKIAEIEEE